MQKAYRGVELNMHSVTIRSTARKATMRQNPSVFFGPLPIEPHLCKCLTSISNVSFFFLNHLSLFNVCENENCLANDQFWARNIAPKKETVPGYIFMGRFGSNLPQIEQIWTTSKEI